MVDLILMLVSLVFVFGLIAVFLRWILK